MCSALVRRPHNYCGRQTAKRSAFPRTNLGPDPNTPLPSEAPGKVRGRGSRRHYLFPELSRITEEPAFKIRRHGDPPFIDEKNETRATGEATRLPCPSSHPKPPHQGSLREPPGRSAAQNVTSGRESPAASPAHLRAVWPMSRAVTGGKWPQGRAGPHAGSAEASR